MSTIEGTMNTGLQETRGRAEHKARPASRGRKKILAAFAALTMADGFSWTHEAYQIRYR